MVLAFSNGCPSFQTNENIQKYYCKTIDTVTTIRNSMSEELFSMNKVAQISGHLKKLPHLDKPLCNFLFSLVFSFYIFALHIESFGYFRQR